MIRFGPMTWQSSARLVALACWVAALALTGGMGWNAWTTIRATENPHSFGASPAYAAMSARRTLTDAEIIANKNRVAR